MACFDNKDYKKIRVDSDDFLRESNPKDRELMKVCVPIVSHFESTISNELFHGDSEELGNNRVHRTEVESMTFRG